MSDHLGYKDESDALLNRPGFDPGRGRCSLRGRGSTSQGAVDPKFASKFGVFGLALLQVDLKH